MCRRNYGSLIGDALTAERIRKEIGCLAGEFAKLRGVAPQLGRRGAAQLPLNQR